MPEADRAASCVILFDLHGNVLLQERNDGTWSIPGGRCEAGELPAATAVREFEEETGVALERVRFFRTFGPLAPHSDANAPPWMFHVFFADDHVPAEAIENRDRDGLGFRYFSPQDAMALPLRSGARQALDAFLRHDKYRGTLATKAAFKQGVGIIEIDRWGRVLLQLRDRDLPPERFPGKWCIPGGLIEPGEAPDAAAVREFEEETGHLLDELKLFRVYRRTAVPVLASDVLHVYFIDADIPEEFIEVNEGQAFRYFAPPEIPALDLPPHAAAILGEFLNSSAYRAMFH